MFLCLIVPTNTACPAYDCNTKLYTSGCSTSASLNQCRCSNNMNWNDASTVCELNVNKFDHATSLVTNDPISLNCESGFQFIQTNSTACLRDCMIITTSSPFTLWASGTSCSCAVTISAQLTDGQGSDTTKIYTSKIAYGYLNKIIGWSDSTTFYGFQLQFEDGFLSNYLGFPYLGTSAVQYDL